MKKLTLKNELLVTALLCLSKRKLHEVKEIEERIAEELGVKDDGSGYYGHVSDTVYNEGDAKTLIRKLGLKKG